MHKKQLLVMLLLCFVAVGCTVDGGSVVKEDLNKIVICKDARDGEIFSFNSNTITNVRRGFGAPGSVDITTDDGKKMTLSDDMSLWLKCKHQERRLR